MRIFDSATTSSRLPATTRGATPRGAAAGAALADVAGAAAGAEP